MSRLDKLLKNAATDNPWYFAAKEGREYLTPEDVAAAIQAGGTVLGVTQAVLQAIEMGTVEDASCTAFVALKMFKKFGSVA